MVRKVPVDFLLPGMVTGTAIYNDDGHVLLASGVTLTVSYIRRLHEMGFPSVVIDDEITEGIIVADVIKESTRVQALKQIKETFLLFKEKTSHEKMNVVKLNDLVEDIIEQITNNNDIICNLSEIRSVDNYLYAHSVNVCVLSIMTGLSLGYNHYKLNELAIGALLHDIGKARIPYEILNKPGELTKEEFELIKKHPAYSLEILKDNCSVSSIARMVAYRHHEKFNGEGYPEGIEGSKFFEEAQIVGMVDIYDAIVSDRCYRKGMPPNEAYEYISGSGDFYFSYYLVKHFLAQVAAYPVGSFVRLSTGEIALVVETHKYCSLTPKVRILFHPDFSPVAEPKEIDLYQSTGKSITKVFTETEISNLLMKNKLPFNAV